MKHAVVAVALALAIPAAARAQRGADRTAESAYERGLASLRANRFGDAVLAFEDSYRAAPVPAVLYNLGLAYRGAGRHRAAVDAFTRYLRDEGAAVPPARRAAVERAMRELRAFVGSIDCRVEPEGALVTVDGTPSACPGAIAVDPGEHQVEARASGHATERRTLRIDAGARADFDVRLTPLPPPAPAVVPVIEPTPTPAPTATPTPPERLTRAVTPAPRPEERPPVYARGWFWGVVGGVAAAALIVGLAVGLSGEPRDPPLDGALFRVEALGAR